jgi:hypothetical protein
MKPRVFNEESWHKIMVKHMIEITEAENLKEENEREEAERAIRKTVKKEIDELNEYSESYSHSEYAKFLQFVGAKYTSYTTGETVTFTEESLESKNIKKTLTKACLHYHSDKSARAKADGMSEGQIYLRSEIIKIITRFINQIKGD